MQNASLPSRSELVRFSGTVWRILFADQSNAPFEAARAPAGRFHHSGQFAIYTSLTAEGCGVAIKRYVTNRDPARVILALDVRNASLLDVTHNNEASMVWQGVHESGQLSPTWAFSDQARAHNADGILYSSRSRPDLTHAVFFSADIFSGRINTCQPWPRATEPRLEE